MSTAQNPPDDGLPAEIDFSGGTGGKFYKPGATPELGGVFGRRLAKPARQSQGHRLLEPHQRHAAQGYLTYRDAGVEMAQ
jgi:hypothetical protein